MNTNFKKIFSFILCAVLLFTTASVAFAADGSTRTVVDSGYCGAQGENLTWTLYDDGELVISGEGEMDWYYMGTVKASKLAPWADLYDKIDVITIEEGVTSIGYNAFCLLPGEFSRFYRINLPKSLEFFEGDLFLWTDTCRVPGQHLAYCYAGSKYEWSDVKAMNVFFTMEKVEGENQYMPVERTFDGSYQYINMDRQYSKLYFNGTEPQPFCEFVKDGEYDFVAHYYPGNARAEKLIWYTIHNDKERKAGEINVGKYETRDIMIPTYKEGEHYIRVDVVDADGNVLVTSEKTLVATTPSYASTIKYFFAEIIYVLWLFIGLPIFGAIALPILKIMDLFGYKF